MMRMVALVIAALALVSPAQAEDRGRFDEIAAVATTHIAPPHVVVWLPPGYDRGTRRYPVVYMNDGQNLFFPKRSSFNKVWAADASALRLIAAHRVAPFIIVGIDHAGVDRFRQYFPTNVPRAAFRAAIEQHEKAPVYGDTYLTFIADDLKPLIDQRYRTRPQPRFTAIAGSSMGGLISLYALGERPDIFGRAAAVSTHLPLVGYERADPIRTDILADWQRWIDTRLGAARGRRLWMDHGTMTLDSGYAAYQEPVDADLARAGWTRGADFESRVYSGAAHEENAWAARLDDAFGWLLRDWK